MPQTTIIAQGTADTTSADFVVPKGGRTRVQIFVPSGSVPLSAAIAIFKKGVPKVDPNNSLQTPATDTAIWGLVAGERPATWVSDPGTYYVRRNASPDAFGVFIEAYDTPYAVG